MYNFTLDTAWITSRCMGRYGNAQLMRCGTGSLGLAFDQSKHGRSSGLAARLETIPCELHSPEGHSGSGWRTLSMWVCVSQELWEQSRRSIRKSYPSRKEASMLTKVTTMLH